MKIFKIGLIFLFILLLVGASNSFAADADGFDVTAESSNNNQELINTDLSEDNSILSQDSDEIEVETWGDIQHYSNLTDKNYILKLKENTNYYPENVESMDSQIIFKNNVTIIGAQGAYIGDTSPDARNITYTAMLVPDNSGIGITLKNITFKWIGTRYQPDGVFCQMGGNTFNYIENCYFTNISTNLGHSSILYIKLGDAVVKNCTFVNCTTDFGCLSVYNPNDDPTKLCTRARMQVYDSYFEGNYARTEPGCINNCGILTVTNSTFYRNSAFWWAGAIHTHGGANTTLYDCNFTDNVAGWNGGALYTYSYLQIYNTIFIGNNCTTNNGGGAIGACKYLHAPYIYIEDSLFEKNSNTCWSLTNESTTGTGRGGAISLMDQGSLEVRNTTFIENSASIGTAICAINGGLQMGSPDVILVGNRFINHTRVGDVLDIRLASSSYLEINDNYYYNNSFEFKKLRLLADEKIGDDVVVHIDAELKNPNSFENDILDTTLYDIYVDGSYNKTVIGKTFNLTIEGNENHYVYAVPLISDSRTNEILVGVPKEYIYVSQQSGKDTNDGLNRTTPVKTMAKAIELARTKGNIVVMDGRYSESNLTVDYNLTIIGENNVKFSGNVPMQVQTIFTVTNSSDLSLSGITFDNIVFTANTTYKNKRVILQDSGYLTIDDCTFSSISPSGNTGMVLIESPNVQVYNSKFTNNNKASVYVTLIKSDEFLVDNCTFTNNIASHTSYPSLIRTGTEKTGVKGTVSNSVFENNKVKYGCIYFGANSGVPITVTNTKFIANTVGGTSDHSSCIKIETAPTLTVDECVFKDNINFGTRAAVIYSSAGSGSIYVSKSIIVNNSYENNNHAVFSASTNNNLKSYKNLNNNWWGNTLENYTVAPAVYASACDNWLVLNMTSNAAKLGYDQKALVSIDFYNAVDRYGNSSFVDASNLPSFDLDVAAQNGTLSASKISVIKGMANVEYTMQSLDGGSVTVSYANIQSTIALCGLNKTRLTADRFEDGLTINMKDKVSLNATLTDFNTGEAISGATVVFLLNDTEYTNVTDAEGKAQFDLSGIDIGKYIVNYRFDGNENYNGCNLTVNDKLTVFVVKANVEILYTNELNVITFNVLDTLTPTGTINVTLGDVNKILTLTDGSVSYNFGLDIAEGGNYTLNVIYGGDKYHNNANLEDTFVIIKSPTVSITDVPAEITTKMGSNTPQVNFNIVCDGEMLTEGPISFDLGESGLKIASAGYRNGAWYARFSTSDANPGEFEITLKYDGDGYYTPANATFKMIILPTVASNLKVDEDKIKVDVKISGDAQSNQKTYNDYTPLSDADGTFTITLNGEAKAQGTISKGVGSASFDKLEPGNYEFIISYTGNDKYPASNGSASLKIPRTSQWASVGGDAQNSGNSIATRDDGVSVLWNASLDGDLVYSAVIDSFGNIYVTDGNNIYAFANNGTLIWSANIESWSWGHGSSGIALYHDEAITSPQSGDEMFIFNATDGTRFGGNYAKGSSVFAPIVGPDGRVYTPTEFGYPADGQGYNGNYWVSVLSESGYEGEPYQFNLFLVEITGVAYEDPGMKESPSFDKEGHIYANTVKGFKIVNIETGATIFNDANINAVGRAVIDSSNIAYILDSKLNGIYAISTEGILWNEPVNGGIGTTLAVDNENEFLYYVNANGTLYKYHTTERDEIKVYDLNSAGVSIILDADGNAYVSTENGNVTAFNIDGDLLWSINLGSNVTGQLAMDNNGIIYVVGDKTLYALGFDANLDVEAQNATVFDDETITVTIAEGATGNVTITVNGENYEVPIDKGTATLDLGKLTPDDYTVTVSYGGDATYGHDYAETAFKITKANAEITADAVSSIEETTITLTLPEDATGKVFVKVDGKTYSANVEEGTAVITITDLKSGNYTAEVTYEGDDNYNNASLEVAINVPPKENLTLEATANPITVGEDAVIVVVGFEDATGDVTVTVNGKSYVAPIKDGKVTVIVSGLTENATAVVTYGGDDNYNNASASVVIVVNPKPKENATISIDAPAITEGENVTVTVTLPGDASGSVTIGNELVPVKDGVASAVLTGLPVGNTTVPVTYSGDDKYNPIETEVTVTVNEKPVPPKENLTISASADPITVGEDAIIIVTGFEDANGNVSVAVNGKTYTASIKNGKASVTVPGLTKNATAVVTYGGDDNYNNASASVVIVVNPKPKENATISIDAPEVTEGENATVTVTLPSDASGSVTIGNELVPVKEGVASAVLAGLPVGNTTLPVTYSGDDKYNPIETQVTVTVNEKPVPPKENLTIKATANPITVGEDAIIIVTGFEDATGNVSVAVNGKTYTAPIKNGKASVTVPGLVKNATASITYAGDNKYNNASASVVIVVNPKPKENATISIDAPEVTEGENVTVTVTLPVDATGSVTVGNEIIPVKDGVASAVLAGLPVGNTTVPVTYSGDDKYNPIETEVIVTVNEKPVPPKENLTISAVADPITVGEDAVIVVSGLKEATGNVSVVVNGKTYMAPIVKGTASVTVPGLIENATALITYAGDDKYNNASASVVIVVNPKPKENLTISAVADPITVGEDATVVVSGLRDATGNVTVTVNGKTYGAPINNGKATVTVPGLVKNATASITYAGDNKYNNASASVDIVVNPKPKENATISIDAPEITEGENATVTVTLPGDATGNVTAVVDGKTYTVPVENGAARLIIPDLAKGDYTVPVTYSGDDKYNSVTKDVTIKVKEDTSDKISAPDVTKYYKGPERFVVTVTDYKGNPLADKTVIININKVDYTRTTDAKGTASMALGLPSNTYNVTVTVDSQSAKSVVTILPTVNGTDVVKMFRNGTQYYATFRDSQGKYLADGTAVQFNINGVLYNRQISGDKGLARLNLNLPQGEYIITAINPQTSEKAANNITVLSKLVENRDITKYFKNGTQYTVKVLGDNGKPVGAGVDVKFNINGVFYTRQTDASGVAKLTINLVPGDYQITAEYGGCKVANTVKILPILSANDVNMKYRDGTKFTATLVDGQGKPYAGQSVSFNINGVFYTRTTDNNGQAKLNINLQAGQYIITSSYNGFNIANKVTITA